MAAGKNKLLRWTRIYVGGYDLSGDARSFGSLDNGYEEADMTGWSEAQRNVLAAGGRMVGIRAFQALMNDLAGQSLPILQNAGVVERVSLHLGSLAEPAIGDPAYLMPAVQMGDRVTWDGGAAALQGDFLPQGGIASPNIDQPWGHVLYPKTALAATTNGASINNGAASTKGGYALLHILASSGGSWTFKVQHSTNDVAWVDLITFTANGSTITSELGSVAGTINQYARFQATRVSGTVTVLCSFARNY